MDQRSQPTMDRIKQPPKREPRASDPRLPQYRGASQNQLPLQSMEIQMSNPHYLCPQIQFASVADEALNPLQHRQQHHRPPRLEIRPEADPRDGGIHHLEINGKQVSSLQKGHIKMTRKPKSSTNKRTSQFEATKHFVHQHQHGPQGCTHVDFSVAQLSDKNYCSSCIGDRLALKLPYGCTTKTDGEFAYAAEVVLKAEFLDKHVAMNKLPEKKHY
ncbi:Histone-lysine N-methyltransferase SUVR4 [Linum grandiflorum]